MISKMEPPERVSPAIAAFLRRWNDELAEPSDDQQIRLLIKPYEQRVIGTNTGRWEDEETRAWLAMDWMFRTYLPAWLDFDGLTEEAGVVRSLSPISSHPHYDHYRGPILDAYQKVDRSFGLAQRWASERYKGGAAMNVGAVYEARQIARTMRDSGGLAARCTADWESVQESDWRQTERSWLLSDIGVTTSQAKWVGVWNAIQDNPDSDPPRLAESRLRPVVESLQKSALDLLDRLIAVGQTPDISPPSTHTSDGSPVPTESAAGKNER